MSTDMTIPKKFADAFNRKDLEGLSELFAKDATAEVLNAGFGVEKGRETIRKTSLPYILDSDAPLTAEIWEEESEGFVLLRETEGARALDMALRLQCADGAIQRIEYLVPDHRYEDLVRIGKKTGIALRPKNP